MREAAPVPAQAASPEIPLGFHVKYVHLVKGAKAAKVKFTWGCEYGDYSLLVQVEQEPPVTTDYVDYDANHFLEGTCDGRRGRTASPCGPRRSARRG